MLHVRLPDLLYASLSRSSMGAHRLPLHDLPLVVLDPLQDPHLLGSGGYLHVSRFPGDFVGQRVVAQQSR